METEPMTHTTPRRSRTGVWAMATLTSILLGVLLALAGSQGSADVGGFPVFALAVALAYAINWIVFVPSFVRHTERFFDLTGSVTYVSITVVALIASPDPDIRAWLAALMVVVWAGRLGSFLFRRISRDGSDGRFDVIKQDFWQFLMTWTLQGLWVSLTAAAALVIITAEDREHFGVAGLVGLAVWVVGFTVEVVADTQKSRFRAEPANAGRYITTGLWAWSRHPNYFGEIVLWSGMAIMSIPVLTGWRWVALVSPVFVFVLLTRISGIPLQRRRAEKRWGSEPEFRAYMDSTPALVPRPPRRAT